MDSMATLNRTGAPAMNVSITSISTGVPGVGDAASYRCSSPAMLPGLTGMGAPSLGGSLSQNLLQTQMLMNQTMLQLMSLMLKLMYDRNGLSSATGSTTPSTSAGSTLGSNSGATAGMPAATATGNKLAEIAKAEATDGDSSGGWCYRDVGRSLRKIGIETSGGSAYMAADQLAKNPKVQEVKVNEADLPKLPAGAIVVWQRGNGHEHGHISIATGDGREASDLLLKQTTNFGTSFRVFMPQ